MYELELRKITTKVKYHLYDDHIKIETKKLFSTNVSNYMLDEISYLNHIFSDNSVKLLWTTIFFAILSSVLIFDKKENDAPLFYFSLTIFFLFLYLSTRRSYKIYHPVAFLYSENKDQKIIEFMNILNENKLNFIKKRLSLRLLSDGEEDTKNYLKYLRDNKIICDDTYLEFFKNLKNMESKKVGF